MKAAIFFVILLVVVGFSASALREQVFADQLQAASKQRIGNYEVEMTTEPKNPIASNSPARILIRIAGVNGDDLVDVPIMIRIVKDGTEIQRTDPIIVPYGHYTHEFTFAQPGRYVLYIDVNDYSYSGEMLTFTFFINVAGTFDFLYIAVPSAAAVAVVTAIVLTLMKKRKKLTNIKRGRQTGGSELG
ncbi:MAG: hypothetical protein ACJ70Z_05760 [Nitrososphaera sp.]